MVALLEAAFEEAAARAGGAIEREFTVAGGRLRLRFAGGALIPGTVRALAHLAAPDDGAPPAFTVRLWDSASTGRPLPLLVTSLLRLLRTTWRADRDTPGEVFAYTDRRVRTAFYGPDLLSVADLERRAGVYWLADASALPYYETGAPLRTMLHWWLAGPKRHLVHGAAVGDARGGLLLVGKGGSGKSTTALSCLGAGLLYAGDDYALLDASGEPPVARSLYQTAKLKGPADLARFPALAPLLCNAGRIAAREGADAEKPMLFVGDARPDLLARELPIRAIVLPVYEGGTRCEVEPATARAAFEAIVPSTLEQLPVVAPEMVRLLASFTRSTPAFRLRLGGRPDDVAEAARGILGRVT